MKKLLIFILIISTLLLSGCAKTGSTYDIVATTLPVYDFTSTLCDGTGLSVGRLITENVSCLHDYTLKVSQMRMIEDAEMIVISGAGLEIFLDDALSGAQHIVDASVNVPLHTGSHNHHEDHHGDHHGDHHDHTYDPHIWLSTENAAMMATSICDALSERYPEFIDVFENNLHILLERLSKLQDYGNVQLESLNSRELITFHDGFAYFAESFDLTILKAIEEESGSEASAKEIVELVKLIESHSIPVIFTETNGSTACAGIVSTETGVPVHTLDMAMSGDSYFDAMYHNIDTIKETLK